MSPAISYVTIYDEYGQPWKVTEGDPLWKEAEEAMTKGEKIYWPLKKITEYRGYGWWSTFKTLDEFEAELDKLVPNPANTRQIELDQEYTPEELRNLLQHFGSYLTTLNGLEARAEAQCHALKEGFNTGIKIAVANAADKKGTVSAREGDVLAASDLFKHTKRMQIDNESVLLLIKGRRSAYEEAWATTSRLISLMLGEVQLQTPRTG